MSLYSSIQQQTLTEIREGFFCAIGRNKGIRKTEVHQQNNPKPKDAKQ